MSYELFLVVMSISFSSKLRFESCATTRLYPDIRIENLNRSRTPYDAVIQASITFHLLPFER